MREVSAAGIHLIKRFEGLRLTAYKCSAGKPTIGWGHTRGVAWGDVGTRTITEEEADRLLKEDLSEASEAVDRLVTVPLNDNQFAALVSFTYNLGAGSLKKSTMRQKINDGHIASAAKEFARWNRSGGRVLPGLVARREAERALFES